MGYEFTNLPAQQLPFKRKNKVWRKKCVDWADSRTFFNYDLVRKSVIHKKINYDLLNGVLHMEDLAMVLNPEKIKAGFIPDKILHYAIMNAKLNVLRGEESKRIFDYKVIITTPNEVSEMQNTKRDQLMQALLQEIQNISQSDEEFQQKIQIIGDYFTFDWQDAREKRANALLKHYKDEYNFPLLFNNGFVDGMAIGEEIYRCDIVGGEPIIERVNPLKIRVFQSGYSNKIEDADIIILEDYWSPGKIVDTYYDVLTEKDRKYIEELPTHLASGSTDKMDNIDDRMGIHNAAMIGEEFDIENIFTPYNYQVDSLMPYDMAGNIRVLQIFWKSRRKIKKVKSYDPQTGEELYNFYPETYICNEAMGEEELIFFINEAWEGTKIGLDIYVNMRPRVILYNRLSNPSRCHFGIVGSIYNLNENKPFSLVDMMKQYNYLYDVIHDRLNKLIARNWGKIVELDLAKVPKGWDVEKWLHFAKTNGLAVYNSFNEGNIGAATGKLAGALNNATSGVIDAEFGNSIQQYINLLDFIKMEMSEVAGISKQREGQVSNRETVGGVERATLQSSHITEWLFMVHEDVKKRALECFLETAKIALRGRSKKFQYILADGSRKIADIDGDEFSEVDYGLVVDSSNQALELSQKLDMLAQAALQTQTLNFSTIMKLYNSCSLAEKQRFVENNEKQMQQALQQQAEQQAQQEAQRLQAESQLKQAEMEQQLQIANLNNETKILVAQIQAESQTLFNELRFNNNEDDVIYSQEEKEALSEKIREFDAKLKLEQEKLAFEKSKTKEELAIKRQQLTNKTKSLTNK